jgi:hypothetical protein
MSRQPMVYTATSIKAWDIASQARPSAPWIPARPLGHSMYPWSHRWRVAWLVLTGRLDALDWEQP